MIEKLNDYNYLNYAPPKKLGCHNEPGLSIEARKTISEAYEKKNEYCEAFDTLTWLNDTDALRLQEPLLSKWQTYISKELAAYSSSQGLYDSRERDYNVRKLASEKNLS